MDCVLVQSMEGKDSESHSARACRGFDRQLGLIPCGPIVTGNTNQLEPDGPEGNMERGGMQEASNVSQPQVGTGTSGNPVSLLECLSG